MAVEFYGFEDKEIVELFVDQIVESARDFSYRFNKALAEMSRKTAHFRESNVFRYDDEPVVTEIGKISWSYFSGAVGARYVVADHVEDASGNPTGYIYIPMEDWDSMGIQYITKAHLDRVRPGFGFEINLFLEKMAR